MYIFTTKNPSQNFCTKIATLGDLILGALLPLNFALENSLVLRWVWLSLEVSLPKSLKLYSR